MIIVSVAFVICWFPNNIYFMIMDNAMQTGTSLVYVGYLPTIFLAYLNNCMNPFIYAMKHEGVKEKLARLIVCHKCKRPAAVANDSRGVSNHPSGTQQTAVGVPHA